MNYAVLAISAVLIAGGSTTVLAATSTAKTTTAVAPAAKARTATTISAVAPSAKKLPLSGFISSYYYGAPVNDLSAKQTTDDAVDAVMGIGTQHLVGLKYKLNATTSISPTLDFNYALTELEAGPNFTWNDSYLKLSRSSILEQKIRNAAIALDGQLRYYVPTSKGSITNNTIGAVRAELDPTITFGKSRLSLQIPAYARYYIQTKDADASGKSLSQWKFYAGQQLNYDATDRITAFLLYENAFVIYKNGTSNIVPAKSNADLEPGVNIKLHERVAVTPYLNWFTNQPLRTTTVNVSADITL